MITLPGSPPKLETLSRTHSRTAACRRCHVARIRVFIATGLGKIQVSKHVETMVMSDHDDVAASGEVLSLVRQQVMIASSGKPTAVHVDQDRSLAGRRRQAGSPDI